MRQIVYSSAAISSPEAEILDIVRASDRNNPPAKCSGMLVYGAQGYLQLLEGPDGPVAALFDAIAQDRRHRILWSRQQHVDARRVALTLPMGFMGLDEVVGDPAIARFLPLLKAPPEARATEVTDALIHVARHKYPKLAKSA